ncbi:hypothetical protein MASR1M74_27140 [Lentimicrobium sp.]
MAVQVPDMLLSQKIIAGYCFKVIGGIQTQKTTTYNKKQTVDKGLRKIDGSSGGMGLIKAKNTTIYATITKTFNRAECTKRTRK